LREKRPPTTDAAAFAVMVPWPRTLPMKTVLVTSVLVPETTKKTLQARPPFSRTTLGANPDVAKLPVI